MPESALGFLLRNLREQRGLSLRELARLSEVDHAYIYRLEAGAKESPSDEVLTKLMRALKAGKRENDMLHFVAQHQADAEWVGLALKDPNITFTEFTTVAATAFRGKRPNYLDQLARVRRLMSEDRDG
jgi:transcriptional regulator with XRE-family HTH domain